MHSERRSRNGHIWLARTSPGRLEGSSCFGETPMFTPTPPNTHLGTDLDFYSKASFAIWFVIIAHLWFANLVRWVVLKIDFLFFFLSAKASAVWCLLESGKGNVEPSGVALFPLRTALSFSITHLSQKDVAFSFFCSSCWQLIVSSVNCVWVKSTN